MVSIKPLTFARYIRYKKTSGINEYVKQYNIYHYLFPRRTYKINATSIKVMFFSIFDVLSYHVGRYYAIVFAVDSGYQ